MVGLRPLSRSWWRVLRSIGASLQNVLPRRHGVACSRDGHEQRFDSLDAAGTGTGRRKLVAAGGTALDGGGYCKTAGSDNCVWLDLNTKNPAERIQNSSLAGTHVPAGASNQKASIIRCMFPTAGLGRQARPTGIALRITAPSSSTLSVTPVGPSASSRACRAGDAGFSPAKAVDFLPRVPIGRRSVYWTNADRLDLTQNPSGAAIRARV